MAITLFNVRQILWIRVTVEDDDNFYDGPDDDEYQTDDSNGIHSLSLYFGHLRHIIT